MPHQANECVKYPFGETPMTVKKQSKENVAAVPADLESGKGKQSGSEATSEPNTGHTAMPHDPAAVGAGPGNQVQENETQPESQTSTLDDLKPGAQPDGTASVGPGEARNEDVEQLDESRDSSGIE
jgi:hypothetical protein